MSRNDNRDPSYDLERNQTLTILLSSKIKRNQLERDSPKKNHRCSKKASEDNNNNKQKGKTKAVKKEPPPSSKMVSAINAYKSDSQQSKTRKKKGKM